MFKLTLIHFANLGVHSRASLALDAIRGDDDVRVHPLHLIRVIVTNTEASLVKVVCRDDLVRDQLHAARVEGSADKRLLQGGAVDGLGLAIYAPCIALVR